MEVLSDVHPVLIEVLVWFLAGAVTVAFSGLVVHAIVGQRISRQTEEDTESPGPDIGAVIGKCENILTVTFVLANAITGLALLFTAKSIVRRDDIKKDPRYYLGGTLVNFTFSVVVAVLLKRLAGLL